MKSGSRNLQQTPSQKKLSHAVLNMVNYGSRIQKIHYFRNDLRPGFISTPQFLMIPSPMYSKTCCFLKYCTSTPTDVLQVRHQVSTR